MELNERETLVRIEQQLKDSVENQANIRRDLKEIFQRIETESKMVTALNGEVKGHSENSKIRWESLEQRLSSVDKTVTSLDKKTEDNEKSINQVKEDHSVFEGEVTASVKATRWVIGIVASLGSILGAVAVFIELLSKIKG